MPLFKEIVVGGCAAALFSLATPAGATEWQLRRLMAPTAAEQAAERRGRIVIYDGLRAEQVEQALDRGFERMDNMMFVRTRYRGPEETEQVEEDGCD